MGDLLTNKLALDDVIGSIYPQHKGADHPSISAERCQGAFLTAMVKSSDISYPQKMDWDGYAIHVLADADTQPGCRLLVSFSNHFEDSVGLLPGEHLDVPRGFRACWIRSENQDKPFVYKVLVERVPLIRPHLTSAVSVHADARPHERGGAVFYGTAWADSGQSIGAGTIIVRSDYFDAGAYTVEASVYTYGNAPTKASLYCDGEDGMNLWTAGVTLGAIQRLGPVLCPTKTRFGIATFNQLSGPDGYFGLIVVHPFF